MRTLQAHVSGNFLVVVHPVLRRGFQHPRLDAVGATRAALQVAVAGKRPAGAAFLSAGYGSQLACVPLGAAGPRRERFVLFDTWLSSVIVGCPSVTFAERWHAAQWRFAPSRA
jgi:hypothetical protein